MLRIDVKAFKEFLVSNKINDRFRKCTIKAIRCNYFRRIPNVGRR